MIGGLNVAAASATPAYAAAVGAAHRCSSCSARCCSAGSPAACSASRTGSRRSGGWLQRRLSATGAAGRAGALRRGLRHRVAGVLHRAAHRPRRAVRRPRPRHRAARAQEHAGRLRLAGLRRLAGLGRGRVRAVVVVQGSLTALGSCSATCCPRRRSPRRRRPAGCCCSASGPAAAAPSGRRRSATCCPRSSWRRCSDRAVQTAARALTARARARGRRRRSVRVTRQDTAQPSRLRTPAARDACRHPRCSRRPPPHPASRSRSRRPRRAVPRSGPLPRPGRTRGARVGAHPAPDPPDPAAPCRRRVPARRPGGRRRLAALAVLPRRLVPLLARAAPAPAQDAAQSVRGTLNDEGERVPGVTITVEQDGEEVATGETDEQGQFTHPGARARPLHRRWSTSTAARGRLRPRRGRRGPRGHGAGGRVRAGAVPARRGRPRRRPARSTGRRSCSSAACSSAWSSRWPPSGCR